jgi:ABC-type sugar transport system permease subunit
VISNVDSSFPALLYFGMWYSLGGGTLLYVATMNGIPEERSEAIRLDGAGPIREFIHLTFPALWPIYSLGLYTGIIGIITSDVGLYTFYGASAPAHLRTFGYWLTVRKFRAASNVFDLPYVAAIGMLQGAIFIPLMFVVRKALQKFGPSED